MGMTKQKKCISERGSIKNHVFHGCKESLSIYETMGDEIIVYFDPDVDGVIAGLLVCRYLVKHGKKFQWYINSHRNHDWSLGMKSIKGKDVIAVDFLISAELVKEICDTGVNLISMDHHENRKEFISYESSCGKKGIVINNQYPLKMKTVGILAEQGLYLRL